MDFNREITRLLLLLLAAFMAMALSASYWAVVGVDSILLREDNPRLVLYEESIQRGSIYDASETLLAQTIANTGTLQRVYYERETSSLLGYYSLRYGTGGVEAAYNAQLRGDTNISDIGRYLNEDILHRQRVGSDIQLTIHASLQQIISDAFGARQGAVVVMRIPDGAILALLSKPDFDPNQLDQTWEQLVQETGNPFFNRVIQGQYQPGGMLQTPLMAVGILTGISFDRVTENATDPVEVNDVTLSCAAQPPSENITLTEAYAYACPRPFALLANEINQNALDNILETLQLDTPPNLVGFTQQINPTIQPAVIENISPEAQLLGQGLLTVNPLNMAGLVGGIVNNGNAPQPYLLQAVRTPSGDWQSTPITQMTSPLMTETVARRLQELMIANVRAGSASPAFRDTLSIGGHAALAYSGDDVQSWFIGFVTLDDGTAATVAVVFENTDDPIPAANIGGIALEATYDILQSER